MGIMLFFGGFLTGLTTVYNTTMIADSVDYMEHRTGKRNDGVFFSGLNFTAKLTAAITAIITNLVFSAVNYTDTINTLTQNIADASAKGMDYTLDFASSYPEITSAMLVLITIIPAAGCILQALPIHRYFLDEKQHAQILEELEEIRAKHSSLK